MCVAVFFRSFFFISCMFVHTKIGNEIVTISSHMVLHEHRSFRFMIMIIMSAMSFNSNQKKKKSPSKTHSETVLSKEKRNNEEQRNLYSVFFVVFPQALSHFSYSWESTITEKKMQPIFHSRIKFDRLLRCALNALDLFRFYLFQFSVGLSRFLLCFLISLRSNFFRYFFFVRFIRTDFVNSLVYEQKRKNRKNRRKDFRATAKVLVGKFILVMQFRFKWSECVQMDSFFSFSLSLFLCFFFVLFVVYLFHKIFVC